MRALTYEQAVEDGLEPREYSYEPILGEYLARLDFKVWGKKLNLQCFFTIPGTGERFRISAFRTDTPRYTPRDGEIDFSEEGNEGNLYRLHVAETPKGKPKWLSAELVKAREKTGAGR